MRERTRQYKQLNYSCLFQETLKIYSGHQSLVTNLQKQGVNSSQCITLNTGNNYPKNFQRSLKNLYLTKNLHQERHYQSLLYSSSSLHWMSSLSTREITKIRANLLTIDIRYNQRSRFNKKSGRTSSIQPLAMSNRRSKDRDFKAKVSPNPGCSRVIPKHPKSFFTRWYRRFVRRYPWKSSEGEEASRPDPFRVPGWKTAAYSHSR